MKLMKTWQLWLLSLIFIFFCVITINNTYLIPINSPQQTATPTPATNPPLVFEKGQKEAYAQNYPDYDVSNLSLLSGTVIEVDPLISRVKLTTNNSQIWIKIASSWQGNVLTLDPATGKYFEKEPLSFSQDGWNKIAGLFKQAKEISLICLDSSCQESIAGHVYLN